MDVKTRSDHCYLFQHIADERINKLSLLVNLNIDFVEELGVIVLPAVVCSLYSVFTHIQIPLQSITRWYHTLPASLLHTLKVGESFKQSLNGFILPANLSTLTFGWPSHYQQVCTHSHLEDPSINHWTV